VQSQNPGVDTVARSYVSFNLTNQLPQAVSGVTLRLSVTADNTKVVYHAAPKQIAALAANESQLTELTVDGLDSTRAAGARTAYTVAVTYTLAGARGEFSQTVNIEGAPLAANATATTATTAATAVPTAGAPAAAAAANDDDDSLPPGEWKALPIKGTHSVAVTGTIRNTLDVAVHDVKITVTLLQDKTTVKTLTLDVGKPLAIGAAASLGATIENCPTFNAMNATVAYQEAESARSRALGKPEPDNQSTWPEGMQGGKQVEVAFSGAANDGAGNVVFHGELRNGLNKPAHLKSISFKFVMANGQVKQSAVPLRGLIAPGTMCSVDLTVPAIGDWNRYEYDVDYRY
ncbi:MAG: hypothetical protein ACREJ2_15465, partial [Planctomycetota bacterium]